MIRTPHRPLTRKLCVALICGVAVLCLPPSGFAEPLWSSNRAGVGLASSLGMVANDGLGASARAAHQGDEIEMLADNLRDQAKADLARHGNGASEGRGRRWIQYRSDRADDARIREGSDGRVGVLSSVTTAVPEPSTLALFGVGLLTAAVWTRRRFGVRTIDR